AAGTLPNDVDGGVIGSAQYARWKANFGSRSAAAAAVPEPGPLSIVWVIGGPFAWRSGRRLRRMPPCYVAP
ncbi:MAG: hypothetical protein AB7U97_25530, partial [Pirellulales bacterium]